MKLCGVMKYVSLFPILAAVVRVECQEQWSDAHHVQLSFFVIVHLGCILVTCPLGTAHYDIIIVALGVISTLINSSLDSDWVMLTMGSRKLFRALMAMSFNPRALSPATIS